MITPTSQVLTPSYELDDKSVSLDEVITLPMYELNNLTLEKMQELQTLLSHKEKKEQLRREHKKK